MTTRMASASGKWSIYHLLGIAAGFVLTYVGSYAVLSAMGGYDWVAFDDAPYGLHGIQKSDFRGDNVAITEVEFDIIVEGPADITDFWPPMAEVWIPRGCRNRYEAPSLSTDAIELFYWPCVQVDRAWFHPSLLYMPEAAGPSAPKPSAPKPSAPKP